MTDQNAGSPPGPQWQPPSGGPPARSGGSIWLGLAIGVVSTVGVFFAAQFLSAYTDLAFAGLMVAPLLMVVVGIVLVANPATRRTGAGLLLSLGAIILILGGLCIALIAAFGGV